MPVTDILVYGSARDTRTPDRAEVRLQVSKWGRDWESIHQSVTAAAGSLMDAIKELEAKKPQALVSHSIAQISQKSWTDDIGAAYSESVEVTAVFSDFHTMSQWIFAQPTETVNIQGITWALSPSAQSELAIALTVEAMRNARRKAETFAASAGLDIIGIQTLADPGLMNTTDTGTRQPVAVTREATRHGTPSSGGIDITPTPIETEIRIEAHFLADLAANDAALFPRRRSLTSP